MERLERNQIRIVGVWRYPTPDINLNGYRTTLHIQKDGSFTKIQRSRGGSTTYEGNYAENEDGTISFHVLSRTSKSLISDALPGVEPKVELLNVTFRCRCAIDKSGYLLTEDLGVDPFAKETGIRWETYMPAPAG